MIETALITGATSGLGKALALYLNKKNISLILTGRDHKELQKLPCTQSLICDLGNGTDREKLLTLIKEKAPDLVINNAGFGLYGEAIDHPLEEELNMIEVNVKAVVAITITAARTLIERKKGGTILNISSAASFFDYPTFATYAATKGFVNQFSLGLDEELKDKNIRVLTACPGQIATHFQERASKGKSQKNYSHAMSPDKVAQALLRQIEKQENLKIINFLYLIATQFCRMIPRRFRSRLLKKLIKNRC